MSEEGKEMKILLIISLCAINVIGIRIPYNHLNPEEVFKPNWENDGLKYEDKWKELNDVIEKTRRQFINRAVNIVPHLNEDENRKLEEVLRRFKELQSKTLENILNEGEYLETKITEENAKANENPFKNNNDVVLRRNKRAKPIPLATKCVFCKQSSCAEGQVRINGNCVVLNTGLDY